MPLSAVRARAFVHHPWFIFHFRRKVQQLDGIPKRSEGAQDERSRSEPHPFQSDSPGVCVGGDGESRQKTPTYSICRRKITNPWCAVKDILFAGYRPHNSHLSMASPCTSDRTACPLPSSLAESSHAWLAGTEGNSRLIVCGLECNHANPQMLRAETVAAHVDFGIRSSSLGQCNTRERISTANRTAKLVIRTNRDRLFSFALHPTGCFPRQSRQVAIVEALAWASLAAFFSSSCFFSRYCLRICITTSAAAYPAGTARASPRDWSDNPRRTPRAGRCPSTSRRCVHTIPRRLFAWWRFPCCHRAGCGTGNLHQNPGLLADQGHAARVITDPPGRSIAGNRRLAPKNVCIRHAAGVGCGRFRYRSHNRTAG